MIAGPKQAAREVLAGQPQAAARRWLGPTVLVMLALFALDTALVMTHVLLTPFDIPVATLVQSINWGPVVFVFGLINVSAGVWQVLIGVVAVVGMFIFERRAGWLVLIGALSSLFDNILKLVISRQRPPSDLVHILTPATGFSYPSGHAVFFTWVSFMVAVSIAPRIKPTLRPVLWLAAALVMVLTCLARVWAGDHWPSDVIGGVLLALGWSAFVLWLPERWLPSPSWRWFRGRSSPRPI
ncbi:MAG TPA: phosphatase PAP2 family protein [Candidatus Dormibacteraeota bacterium]|nr:phosphatase PAP2 family protein [Candidatus Dormibacteraeota bacterium]